MSVYVDSAKHRYGRMLMSHMVADSDEELLAMADSITLPRRWHQKPGTYRSHFDLCQSKRALAIHRGAIVVSQRELGRILRAKR